MAAADPSSQHSANFDVKTSLKNYATNMAMTNGQFLANFWPMAAAGAATAADSSTGSMFGYSQASALAAAASSIQSLTNGHSSSGNGNIVTNGNGNGGLAYNSANGHGNSGHLFGSPAATCGTLSLPAHSTTPSTPKKKPQPVPDVMKDESYWERRKRNNESARRSRESRRLKEEQISYNVMRYETENLHLRTEVAMLRNEIEKLRMLLYQSNHR